MYEKELFFPFFSIDESEEEEGMSDGDGDENGQTEESEDNYDAKHVKFAEEQETYSKIKAARQDEMFPDEVSLFLLFLNCYRPLLTK